jgi:hypothetical protein
MWLDHVDRVITFQHQPGVSAFTFTGCNRSHQIYLEGIDLHNCFPSFLPAHNLQGWFMMQARAEESCYCFPHCSTSEPENPDVPKEWPANSNTKTIRILLNAYLKSSNPPAPPPQKRHNHNHMELFVPMHEASSSRSYCFYTIGKGIAPDTLLSHLSA